MKKIGLIINPIAGLGGSVGLKGTDHVAAEALRRGAVPHAGDRAERTLQELLPLREELEIYTRSGAMGGEAAKKLGFRTVLKETADASPTTAADTKVLAAWLLREQVDLILFAGGDGTARDIYTAVGTDIACVGIPAGVKIHSPVYARNPEAVGRLAVLWITGKLRLASEEEVLDIDEEEYRREHISTRQYGYLRIPKERTLTQDRKAPTPLSDAEAIEAIAGEAIRLMEPDTYYIIGAGTTPRAIMRRLGLKNTLIGVDVICNRKVIGNDLGGRSLLVDTGDSELDHALCGYYRVICGWGEAVMCRVGE